jgi:hypothetical protein
MYLRILHYPFNGQFNIIYNNIHIVHIKETNITNKLVL